MSAPAARPHAVVVGGGLSGLVAAHRLHELGSDVRLVEQAEEPGGNLRTSTAESDSGRWLLDLGPNSFGDAATVLMDVAGEVGLDRGLVSAAGIGGRRFLYTRGRLRAVTPARLLFGGLLPPLGALRLLKEPFVRPRPGGEPEETLAAFCDRRLGVAARRRLLTAVVGGIYAGDPERLGAESAFPAMVALEREHGSLVRAALRGSGPPKRGALVNFRGGMAALPRAIAARLGERYEGGVAVDHVQREGDGLRVVAGEHVWHARHVVIAVPAPAAADVLEPLLPGVAAELRGIRYAPMTVVHLGVRRVDRLPDGFGFLVPREQGVRALGCVFASRLFTGRAPEGHDLLTVFVGGDLDPGAIELGDDELTALARRDVETALGTALDMRLARVTRWPRAIPQYEVGHRERCARIAAEVASVPGLHVLGNWTGGIALPACAQNADSLARGIGADVAPVQSV